MCRNCVSITPYSLVTDPTVKQSYTESTSHTESNRVIQSQTESNRVRQSQTELDRVKQNHTESNRVKQS